MKKISLATLLVSFAPLAASLAGCAAAPRREAYLPARTAGAGVAYDLDKQAAELDRVSETKRTANGILVKLRNDLLFDTGSSVMKPEAMNEVTRLGEILAKYREDRIRIEGHTDSVGSRASNERLSAMRAEAVSNVLEGSGVPPTRIFVIGMGESRPERENRTLKGRSQNRRVELHIDLPNQVWAKY